MNREQKATSPLGQGSAGGHILPHVAGPHCGSFRIRLQNTGKSGFLAPETGEKWQGLEAGTDPQTVLAAGKGSFLWVTGIFLLCVT